MSFAQQRLWFLSQLEGPSPTYNLPFIYQLTGTLNPDALHHALTDVITRHDALRTTLTEHNGEPVQIIHPPQPATLRHLTTTQNHLDTQLQHEVNHCFDLTHELPVRATLIHLNDTNTHVLILLFHHIANDAWSMRPLARDLSTAYQARLTNTTPTWNPLPVQYADYAIWQRTTLGTENDPHSPMNHQLTYWKTTLDNLPPELTYPTDRPRPTTATQRGEGFTTHLDPTLHHTLTTLAHTTGTTLSMIAHTTLATLLTKLGAGTDIPIGTPVAGRTDQALDDLVGCFLNTLVIRVDTSGDPTFRELLSRVRETSLAAYENQDVPFERVVEALNPPRHPARNPLFQVMQQVNFDGAADLPMPGVSASRLSAFQQREKFDLSLTLYAGSAPDGGPGPIEVFVRYAVDLFDRRTVETMIDRLTHLLRTAATEPDRHLSELDILEQLPLTSSGTVHRYVPPAAGIVPPPPAAAEPQTVQERLLCTLFADVLGRPQVGPDENFFHLGGHSLLATRLITRVRNTFKTSVSVRAVFEAPTPRLLARHLITGGLSHPFEVVYPIRSDGDQPALFCLHSGGGLSWVYSGLLRYLEPGVPVYGIQSPAMSDTGRRPDTLAEMAGRYVEYIRTVQPQGPYRLLGWSLGGTFAHEVAVQLQQGGHEVSFLAILDTNMVYDPEAGRTPVPGELLQYHPGDPEDTAAEIRELSVRVPTLKLLHGEEQRMALSAYHYNRAIRMRHLPGHAFRGDVLFVRATADKGELIAATETWGPYVEGHIDEIRIDCTHYELLAMAPLLALGEEPSLRPIAVIGEAVSKALRRQAPPAG